MAEGLLEILNEGWFSEARVHFPSKDDIYFALPDPQVRFEDRRLGVRAGTASMTQRGITAPPYRSINGEDPETARDRPNFEGLTPIFQTFGSRWRPPKGTLQDAFLISWRR